MNQTRYFRLILRPGAVQAVRPERSIVSAYPTLAVQICRHTVAGRSVRPAISTTTQSTTGNTLSL